MTKPPSAATLRKYGLTAEEWLAILEAQGGVCAICERVPKSGRWVTDHRHRPGWRKLPAIVRRRYVRGVICAFCNSHVVGRFVTLAKARNAVKYLESFEARLAEIERASVKMKSVGHDARAPTCKRKSSRVEL